jgi:hypothetical protein
MVRFFWNRLFTHFSESNFGSEIAGLNGTQKTTHITSEKLRSWQESGKSTKHCPKKTLIAISENFGTGF